MPELNCLDLFCGAGGLSYGFADAGFNIIAGIDNDEESLITFRQNHLNAKGIHFDLSQDLFTAKSSELVELRQNKIDIIIGGPPCQGLSIAGKRILDDPRNVLYKAYINLIKYFRPKALVLENVPTINSLFGGRIARAIVSNFESLGYTVTVNTVYASDYGVPQKRRRTFFVALLGEKFIFPEPLTADNPITTLEALSDLPLLEDDGCSEKFCYVEPPQNNFQTLMRIDCTTLYNHEAVKHTTKTREIIKLVPDGGNYKSLPQHLQNTRRVNIAWTRMSSCKPSFTIDAGHNHHFHYKANRVPTVRECARFQSFPDRFVFYGKKGSQYRQVGNAVPPLLAKVIALKIREYLNV